MTLNQFTPAAGLINKTLADIFCHPMIHILYTKLLPKNDDIA